MTAKVKTVTKASQILCPDPCFNYGSIAIMVVDVEGKERMTGIFYDPSARRLHTVRGRPNPNWAFVTHNLNAGQHQCRRILREWLPSEDLLRIDWSALEDRSA